MLLKKCNHSLCNHAKNKTLDDGSIKTILKEHDFFVTKQRVAILKILMEYSLPLTAEEVVSKMGKNACDLATVYRVLKSFSEAKIANTVFLAKDIAHYEYNNPLHHHHHIICNTCKKMELIEDCALAQIELLLSKKGYQNLTHKLEFYGTCKNCLVA